MAHPHRDTKVAEVLRECENTLVSDTCKFLVSGAVDVLDIEHNEVGVFERFVDFLVTVGVVDSCRSVKTGVYSLFIISLEKLLEELGLSKRFAARSCDPARFQELLV